MGASTVSFRRRSLLQAAALSAVVPAARAQAPAYPDRPIKLLVPWPPGGGADTLSRVLAPHLAKRVGQSVVIDNKPGAAGNIGAELGAQATPDGYTVLFATAATHAINPGLYASVRFKPSDFLPVGRLATITNIVVVHPDLRVRNVQELIALARTRQVNYASAGNGSTQHLCAEMFKMMSGVDLTHVPYKGGGPAVAATLAGDTQVLFADPLAAIPFVKAGRLRAIAVTGSTRLASLPDVPTVAESGVPNYEALNWSGLMVPAGTPARIVAYLNREVNAVLEMPEVKSRLGEQGYEASPSTPAEFEKLVETETARWGQIIKVARVKLD